jgi:hypothetical protein
VVVVHEVQSLQLVQEVSAAHLQLTEERLPLIGLIDPRRPGVVEVVLKLGRKLPKRHRTGRVVQVTAAVGSNSEDRPRLRESMCTGKTAS